MEKLLLLTSDVSSLFHHSKRHTLCLSYCGNGSKTRNWNKDKKCLLKLYYHIAFIIISYNKRIYFSILRCTQNQIHSQWLYINFNPDASIVGTFLTDGILFTNCKECIVKQRMSQSLLPVNTHTLHPRQTQDTNGTKNNDHNLNLLTLKDYLRTTEFKF